MSTVVIEKSLVSFIHTLFKSIYNKHGKKELKNSNNRFGVDLYIYTNVLSESFNKFSIFPQVECIVFIVIRAAISDV